MTKEVVCGDCGITWVDSPAMMVSIQKWNYCPYCATGLVVDDGT